MDTENQEPEEDEMKPEYDFTHGVRGKFADAYRRGYTVIIHYPDGSTTVEKYPGFEDSDVPKSENGVT